MQQLAERLKAAAAARNARECGRIADILRLRHGFNYAKIQLFVAIHTDLDDSDWEALMLEADHAEGAEA